MSAINIFIKIKKSDGKKKRMRKYPRANKHI